MSSLAWYAAGVLTPFLSSAGLLGSLELLQRRAAARAVTKASEVVVRLPAQRSGL